MFTNGGADSYEGGFGLPSMAKYGMPKIDGKVVDSNTAPFAVQVATIKLMHSTKMFLRVVCVVAVVWLAVMLFCRWIPEATQAWKGYNKSDKFSQKENLQWLGASTDIVRGDYENNQDSLAERSMKTDARITDISQPMAAPAGTKLTFLSRERYMSPEEELMKKQQSA